MTTESTEQANFEPESRDLVSRAEALTIESAEDYARAGELLVAAKGLAKQIAGFFKPLKEKAQAAHRSLCDAEREQLAPIAKVESALKPRLAAWDREQERIRREEEARLRELARKAEEDARLQEAVALEEQGEPELAERVLDQPAFVPPVVVPKATPKVAGLASREVWKATCEDFPALLRAIADGTAPSHLVSLNEGELNRLATALKQTFAVPGCRAYTEKQIAAGGRR